MQSKNKLSLAKVGLVVAAAVIAGGANAATYLWDFTSDPGSTTPSFADISLSGTPSITIGISAYYAPVGGGTISAVTGTGRGLTNFDPSGFGMTNPNESIPNSSPNHAVDSIGQTKEYVVIDAWNGAATGTNIDWSGIQLGWATDDYGQAGAQSNRADIQLWAVNNPANFANTAALGSPNAVLNNLSGPTGTPSTYFTSNLDATCTGNACTGSGGANIGASRYLVIAGNINDAFKLRQIGGTTGSPPNQTPEPASLGLLGLGLLGLGYARSRKAKAA